MSRQRSLHYELGCHSLQIVYLQHQTKKVRRNLRLLARKVFRPTSTSWKRNERQETGPTAPGPSPRFPLFHHPTSSLILTATSSTSKGPYFPPFSDARSTNQCWHTPRLPTSQFSPSDSGLDILRSLLAAWCTICCRLADEGAG